jgi:flagellar biosynthesis protein FlhG
MSAETRPASPAAPPTGAANAGAPRTAPSAVATNIMAVASGKGGVGKTWFSVTLSHTFAYGGEKVLLIDGDLGLANVDIQLGLTPGHDLASVISGRARLDEAISGYAGGSAQRGQGGGFDILAGKSGSGALATLALPELQRLRDGLLVLSRHYDRLVIDLAAGLDPSVLTLSMMAGSACVVVTDEPTSLTDAYAFIKTLVQRGAKIDMRIVVNQAQGRIDGERTFDTLRRACESFLQVSPTLAGIVRRDPRVKECIRLQTPILARYPTANAAADVQAIAARIRDLDRALSPAM